MLVVKHYSEYGYDKETGPLDLNLTDLKDHLLDRNVGQIENIMKSVTFLYSVVNILIEQNTADTKRKILQELFEGEITLYEPQVVQIKE